MKKVIIFLSLVIALISCQSETSPPELNSDYDITKTVDVEKWINEIIDIDSALINGKLKVITTKSEVIESFGSPQKKIEIEASNYLAYLLKEDENSIPYHMVFKGISFEGVNNKVIIRKISFDGENIFLKTPSLELRTGMHVRKICELYPESCKLTILGGNTWTGHIELRASKKALFEDLRWFLVFKNELLVGVELYRFL